MALERLLAALHRVRTGRDQSWTARCPAHDDRDPSLSIRALPDGRILIHCFGGCSAAEVVGAVGMDLADLMGPRTDAAGLRHPWRPEHLPPAIQREALIMALFIDRVGAAEDYLLEDLDRALLASQRLLEALGGPSREDHRRRG